MPFRRTRSANPRPTARLVLCLGAAVPAALAGCERSAPSSPPAGAARSGEAARLAPQLPPPVNVLVYTRTAGFRHDSIEAGVASLERAANMKGWRAQWTEDPTVFTDQILEAFDVVLFLNTTGDVLDDEQQGALERFIAAGKGFVGVHSAADTEYDWAWYAGLIGAYFKGHPPVQEARIVVETPDHPSTRHLPEEWTRTDEWYDYRTNPRDAAGQGAESGVRITILASLIESSYDGGGMGEDHPIAWCHEYGGGRAWYTGGGHTSESFSEPAFLEHLTGGILWASGKE